MRTTRKNIEAAILEKHGHRVEIVKGDGYWYFCSAEEDYRTSPLTYAAGTSVWVMHLTDFSVDRWVAAYEELIEGVEVPELSEDTGPKTIVLTGWKF